MTLTLTRGDGPMYDDGPRGSAMTALTNALAAVVSLTLLAGLGFWSWQLFVRDVSGVPVVRAIEGPMRIAPSEPGGAVADNIDLSVTRVASLGAEDAPTDHVTLAPASVGLADEDRPVAALIPDTPSAAQAAGVAAGEAAGAGAAPAPAMSAIEMAIAEALQEQASLAAPEPDLTLQADPPTEGAHAAQSAAGLPTDARRPQVRPDRAMPVVEARAATPAGRLVQLGAFATETDAEAAWASLEERLGPALTDRERVIQLAEAGGSTFYRLRVAGFGDLADARRFCAEVVARDEDCIPVARQ